MYRLQNHKTIIKKGMVSGFVAGVASRAFASVAWRAKIVSSVPAMLTIGNAVISAAKEW